jgi:hypothetical protein
MGEEEKEFTSRGVAQITIAIFENSKCDVREKRNFDYYAKTQSKKDIRDDRQKLRELESKEKLWKEAKSKINIESFLKSIL